MAAGVHSLAGIVYIICFVVFVRASHAPRRKAGLKVAADWHRAETIAGCKKNVQFIILIHRHGTPIIYS